MNSVHPYTSLPDHCFWSRVHTTGEPLDPVVSNAGDAKAPADQSEPIRLGPDTRIATAGSCFAQHIARHLRKGGYSVMDAEPAHPVISPEVAARFGHGIFSARYGNIYTARQLLQLAQRANGALIPLVDRWHGAEGQLIDPFRPTVEPDGFNGPNAFEEDRRRHLAAVRDVMQSAEVLIFTLGLTEAWRDRADGAIYPLAPGVAGGQFDPERHEFVNFTVEQTVADFTEFLSLVRRDNPDMRVILTVSPVPLAATARADMNVVTATSYSKAVLRVAAETLAQTDPGTVYFPSYEIITSLAARGRYFGADLRTVEPAGVRHVMKIFSRHFAPELAGAEAQQNRERQTQAAVATRRVERALDVICDEQQLDEVSS